MDQEAFQHFYEGTAAGLRRYLRHVLGDRDLADDIFQEAFFRMLKANLPAGMDFAHQKNYLYKIATNLMHDHRKARRFDSLPEGYESSVVTAPDEVHDVQQAFGQLRMKERNLLWLAYVECYRHDEIAALVDTTTGSVRPMLARAREKLRRLLSNKPKEGTHEQ